MLQGGVLLLQLVDGSFEFFQSGFVAIGCERGGGRESDGDRPTKDGSGHLGYRGCVWLCLRSRPAPVGILCRTSNGGDPKNELLQTRDGCVKTG